MKKNKKKGSAAKPTKQEPAEAPAPEPVAETADAPPTSDEQAPKELPEEKTEDKPEDKPQDKPMQEAEKPVKEKTKDEDDDESSSSSSSSSDDDDDEASPAATPSLAQQSKLRSTSFRAGSIPSGGAASPFSPDGETAPDIYRKHMARIEELEKENKRLSKEASDSEKRWQKAENELADIREADVDDSGKTGGHDDGLWDSLVSQWSYTPWSVDPLTHL